MKVKGNLANLITLSRLFLTPLMAYFVFKKEKHVFLAMAIFLFITDILDGLIARLLKTESDLGRKLDTLVDWPFYSLVTVGWALFSENFLLKNLFLVILDMFFIVFPVIIALLRLKRIPAVHLRTQQFSIYIFFILLITSLLFGYRKIIFYFFSFICFIVFVELLLFYLFLRNKSQENLHSIFSLLKDLKRKDSEKRL